MKPETKTEETSVGTAEAKPSCAPAPCSAALRECPHCHGSLTRYEDPVAVKIIARHEADLYEQRQWLNNAERILRDLGYDRCTAAACNCSSYHRRETPNDKLSDRSG